jgi:hypothetical protein
LRAKAATVSMGEWHGVDANATEDVKQRIRELVTNSEGGVVKFTVTSQCENRKELRDMGSNVLRQAVRSAVAGAFPLVLLVGMGVNLGCVETVSFNVLRPAKVNVRGIAGEGKDATVSLGEWQGVDSSAVEDVKQRIRELVTNSEGGVVKFAQSDGVVHLDGNVAEHSSEENVTSKQDQCSKVEGKKTVTYACTKWTRTAKARVRVSMNVLDQTGKTLAADTFSDSVVQQTYATDEQPPPIDRDQMLSALRAGAAEYLARLVVPYRVMVQKRWYKCGDANDTCKAALTQLRGGNFEAAIDLLKKAIDQLKAAPKPDAKALAAAWWGLTLAQEFSGDYAAARASLQEAINANPNEEAFASEKSSIQQEENSRKQVAKQVGGE